MAVVPSRIGCGRFCTATVSPVLCTGQDLVTRKSVPIQNRDPPAARHPVTGVPENVPVTSTPVRRPRVRAPELTGQGAWLNTGGRGPLPRGPARQGRPARLLDVLLHQLPARPRRAAPAGGGVRRRAGDRRGALAEVRARGRPGRAGRGRRALRRAPPGARRPRAGDLAAVRRAGLADAGRRRPRGLRRRPALRRGPRARADRAGRRAGRASTRRRARCTAATARTSRRRRPRPRCASPARRWRSPAAPCWSATPAHHSLVELAADGESVLRRIGSGERGLADGGPERCAVQRAAGAVPAAGRGAATGRLRRGRRRHRQPRAARRPARRRRGHDGRRHRTPVDAGLRHRGPVVAVGRRVVRRAGGGRDGGHPPALVVRPGHRGGRPCSPAPRTRGCSTARPPTAWFAQTSGLAAAGDRLWLADSETSSLRHRRRTASSRPTSAPGSSTSATSTDRPRPALLQHPLGRDRAARRLGRGERHLQRRRTPVRPGVRRGDHAAHRAGRAECRGAGRRRPGGRRVGGPPADPAAAAGGGPGGRGRGPAHPARGHRGRRRARSSSTWSSSRRPGQKLDEPLRPVHPAGRHLDPARAAARGRGRGHGPDPAAGARRARRRGRAARRRDGGVLRRRRPATSSRPATCTSRTGACRSGSSRARRRELRLFLAG